MLHFPTPTTREEKLEMIHQIKDRFLHKHGEDIIAIGVYGSVGLGKDGPYSDIEMHVVTKNGISLKGHEFIYDKFKIEISTNQKDEIYKEASEVTDMWPIKAGSYVNILPIYDPSNIFEELKGLPFQAQDEEFRYIMKEFMIWEPYETMGKIRNNFRVANLAYVPLGAKDLTWQTAKLIGLANKQYYSTRANTYQESLQMNSKPSGYESLVNAVMEGELRDKQHVYELCENLWIGLNEWFEQLGIDYKVDELPLF